MVTHKIRNRGTRSAGPRYDDWSGSADRGGNNGGGGGGTGAFSAQQAPRPDGLLVDSVGVFSSPVRTVCRSLSVRRTDKSSSTPPPKWSLKNIDLYSPWIQARIMDHLGPIHLVASLIL